MPGPVIEVRIQAIGHDAVRRELESLRRAGTSAATSQRQVAAATTAASREAAAQARATQQANRALTSLRSSLGGAERAASQQAVAMQRLNAAYAAGLVDQREFIRLQGLVRERFTATAVASRSLGAQFGGLRTAVAAVGQQTQDLAIVMSAGMGMGAAAIQVGQMTSAFGPWGVAIGTAITLTGVLAASLLTMGEDSDEASEAGKRLADTQADLKKFLGDTTTSIIEQAREISALTGVTRQFAAEQLYSQLAAAQAELAQQGRALITTLEELELALLQRGGIGGMIFGGEGQPQEIVPGLLETLDAIQRAQAGGDVEGMAAAVARLTRQMDRPELKDFRDRIVQSGIALGLARQEAEALAKALADLEAGRVPPLPPGAAGGGAPGRPEGPIIRPAPMSRAEAQTFDLKGTLYRPGPANLATSLQTLHEMSAAQAKLNAETEKAPATIEAVAVAYDLTLDVSRQFAQNASQGLADAAFAGEGLATTLQDIGLALSKSIVQALAFRAIMLSLGIGQGGAATGGGLLGLFGATPPPARQGGGPVARGRPYLVGEGGAELFVPDRSGRVMSNREIERRFRPPDSMMKPVVNVGGPEIHIHDERGAGAPPIEQATDINGAISFRIRSEVGGMLRRGELQRPLGIQPKGIARG